MKKFEEDYLQYWHYVENVVDEDGWTYSKEVPHLLDMYFESNTGIKIEFEKSYDGIWRGSRWRPITIKDKLNENI